MKALILRQNVTAAVNCAQALMEKGFHITYAETRDFARALIKADTMDLLVMDERVGGRLTHAVALSAERRNPYVSTIMLTDRTGPETDELYDLIPSLYGLVGMDSSGPLISQLALSSTENYDEAAARVRRNAALVAEDERIEDSDADLRLAYDRMMDGNATTAEEEAEETDVLAAVSAMAAATPAPADQVAAPEDGDAELVDIAAVTDQAIVAEAEISPEEQSEAEDRADLAFEEAEKSARDTALQDDINFDEHRFAGLTASLSFTQSGAGLTADDPMLKIAVGA